MLILPLVLSALLLVSGCVMAPPFRAHPELEQRAATIKSVVFLPPRVEVFQLDAGGLREKMDDWSAQAKKNLVTAIEEDLRARPGLGLRKLADTKVDEPTPDLEETLALFDAINWSITLHSQTQDPGYSFPEKVEKFDYSLGEEAKHFAMGQGDALLLVNGVDHISTSGRVALQVAAVLIGGAAGVVIIPQGGVTALSAALVEAQTGSILWHKASGSAGGHDLRDPESVRDLVRELLDYFPVGTRERAEPSPPRTGRE